MIDETDLFLFTFAKLPVMKPRAPPGKAIPITGVAAEKTLLLADANLAVLKD